MEQKKNLFKRRPKQDREKHATRDENEDKSKKGKGKKQYRSGTGILTTLRSDERHEDP